MSFSISFVMADKRKAEKECLNFRAPLAKKRVSNIVQPQTFNLISSLDGTTKGYVIFSKECLNFRAPVAKKKVSSSVRPLVSASSDIINGGRIVSFQNFVANVVNDPVDSRNFDA
jgi:hypothetical protein